MRGTSITVTVVLLALAFFAISSISAPSTASAQYRHRSEKLPGMQKFPTTLVIIAGVAVVGTVTYLIIKKSQKDKDEGEWEGDESIDKSDEESDEASFHQSGISLASTAVSEKRSNVGLYLDVDQTSRETLGAGSVKKLSDMTVKVGLSFGF